MTTEEALKQIENLKEFIKNNKPVNIKDRVKSYEDACKELGKDPSKFQVVYGESNEERSDRCYQRLKIIFKALCQDWKADYSDEAQKKWYPWFVFDKKLGRFGFYLSHYEFSHSGSGIGVRFCLPSQELSNYMGTQFIDEFNGMLL